MLKFSALFLLVQMSFTDCKAIGKVDSAKNIIILEPNLNLRTTHILNYYGDMKYMRLTKWNIGGYVGGGYGFYNYSIAYNNIADYANQIKNYEVGAVYRIVVRNHTYNMISFGYYKLYNNEILNWQKVLNHISYRGIQVENTFLVPISKHFFVNTGIGYSNSNIIITSKDINMPNINTAKYEEKNIHKFYFQIRTSYCF